MKIILASKSLRRRKLLKDLGLEFRVIPSNVDEGSVQEQNPIELVRKLAMMKAAAVSKGMKEHAIVIGADTVVSIDAEILGKPRDAEDAARMLNRLSGKEHRVYTGLCLINTQTGNVFSDVQKTKVRFRNLVQKDIDQCLKVENTLDGAGAYVPETHLFLFYSIEGSYTNVLGLPVEKLIPMLRENGVDV